MAAKFMKIKRLILPLITVVILTSQLTGCATVTQQEMTEMLQDGQEVEIEIMDVEVPSQRDEIQVGDTSYVIDDVEAEEVEAETVETVDENADLGVLENIGVIGGDVGEPVDEAPIEEAPPVEAEEQTPVIDLFRDVQETVFVTASTVNIRSGPGTQYEKVGQLSWGESIHRIGIGTAEADGWSEVELADGNIVYVSSSHLSLTKPIATQQSTNTSSGSNNSSSSSNNSNSNSSSSSNSNQSTSTQQPEQDKPIPPTMFFDMETGEWRVVDSKPQTQTTTQNGIPSTGNPEWDAIIQAGAEKAAERGGVPSGGITNPNAAIGD